MQIRICHLQLMQWSWRSSRRSQENKVHAWVSAVPCAALECGRNNKSQPASNPLPPTSLIHQGHVGFPEWKRRGELCSLPILENRKNSGARATQQQQLGPHISSGEKRIGENSPEETERNIDRKQERKNIHPTKD